MQVKRYRIKSKVKFTAFVSVLLLIIVLFANMTLGLSRANGATEEKYVQVEVIAGDTLWDIAKAHMPGEKDCRDAVHRICSINDISASDLTPGMILEIPTKGEM